MSETPDTDDGFEDPINWLSIVLGAFAAAGITIVAVVAILLF